MWSSGSPRSEIEAALPGYSWHQIRMQAQARRFPRPARPMINSGYPVIDQIKLRARELNMSMRDIDELARSGSYFYSAAWRQNSRPNPKHIANAIAALDGHIEAVWH